MSAHPPAHPTGSREAAFRVGIGVIRTRTQVSCHPAVTRVLAESESVLFPKDTVLRIAGKPLERSVNGGIAGL